MNSYYFIPIYQSSGKKDKKEKSNNISKIKFSLHMPMLNKHNTASDLLIKVNERLING
jgi:hypothetical protein